MNPHVPRRHPGRPGPVLRVLAAVLALLGGMGCLGYRVGPVLQSDYRSVAVPMFKNDTLQPQIEAQITNAIIKRLQADGTLRVRSEADADVVLTGKITRHDRTGLRSSIADTRNVREYGVSIAVEIEARHRRTGRIVVQQQVITGHADTFIGTDLQSADAQVLPLVADDVARQVVRLLVENW